MQINDRMEQLHNAVSQTYTAVEPDGPGNCGKQERGRSREIVCEHFLDVYVDEQLTFRLTCTATHLPELILGRLFTEGWIQSIRDVESITICESGRSARVFLKENLQTSVSYPEITAVSSSGLPVQFRIPGKFFRQSKDPCILPFHLG